MIGANGSDKGAGPNIIQEQDRRFRGRARDDNVAQPSAGADARDRFRLDINVMLDPVRHHLRGILFDVVREHSLDCAHLAYRAHLCIRLRTTAHDGEGARIRTREVFDCNCGCGSRPPGRELNRIEQREQATIVSIEQRDHTLYGRQPTIMIARQIRVDLRYEIPAILLRQSRLDVKATTADVKTKNARCWRRTGAQRMERGFYRGDRIGPGEQVTDVVAGKEQDFRRPPREIEGLHSCNVYLAGLILKAQRGVPLRSQHSTTSVPTIVRTSSSASAQVSGLSRTTADNGQLKPRICSVAPSSTTSTNPPSSVSAATAASTRLRRSSSPCGILLAVRCATPRTNCSRPSRPCCSRTYSRTSERTDAYPLGNNASASGVSS